MSLYTEKYRMNSVSFNYFAQSWLPLKEKFVMCFTNRVKHYNSTVTSRVESAHIPIKSILNSSTGNIKVVIDKISVVVKNQYRNIMAKIETDMIRVPLSLDIIFFSGVIRKVSSYALKMVLEEYRDIQRISHSNPVVPCTTEKSGSLGIPCIHKLLEMRRLGRNLNVNDFDSQWWLTLIERMGESLPLTCSRSELLHSFLELNPQRQDELLSLVSQPESTAQPPQSQRTRGRPRGAVNRIPSQFERVEAEVGDRRSNICGHCQERGHNRRTCPNRNS